MGTPLQAESQVLSSSGSDRSVVLYDLRSGTPLRKLVMQTSSNAIAWNPMEPLNFVVANEDCNLYSYDMRRLDRATCVHEVPILPPKFQQLFVFHMHCSLLCFEC
jgi:DDB1- and CUL4-associated factor 13